MKNKFFFAAIISFLSISLFSCSKEKEDSDPDTPTDPTVVDEFDGFEITNDRAVKPTSGVQAIKIYGINDFHGAVKEDGRQMGIGYLGSFMKAKTSEPNTLFIDSGDTWQGSLESNYNKGKLINEVFENAKLSVRTVGNHDFDWGVDALASNVELTKFPNLAANVYDFNWNDKKVGENQQEQFGKTYATYVLDNGVKVGIIGTIGDEQITSISTQLVKNITFTNQDTKIKKVSDFLRTKKKCDIIIASSHSSYDQMNAESLTKISSVSNKRYVDLVLNAHTHKAETFETNGVHFAQFGGYGEIVGEVKLYYNFKTNQLVDSSTSVDMLSASKVKTELQNKVDDEIQKIVDKYDAETKYLGSQVLSTKFTSPFYSSEQLPNLMAEAIAVEAKKEGFTVDFGYTNYARASHYNTTMTYSDLYNIFPFDNSVPVIKVSGREALNMLRFRNNIYKVDPSITFDYYKVYTVACLDYLAFHCDEERDYDNFPNFEVVGYLKKNNNNYIYREILKDYLLANQDKTFDTNYYSFNNPIFSREG